MVTHPDHRPVKCGFKRGRLLRRADYITRGERERGLWRWRQRSFEKEQSKTLSRGQEFYAVSRGKNQRNPTTSRRLRLYRCYPEYAHSFREGDRHYSAKHVNYRNGYLATQRHLSVPDKG